MPEPPPPRNRTGTSIRIIAVVGLMLAAAFGLASRQSPLSGWPVIGTYGGDAAWAMAAYAGWRLLCPARSIMMIAVLSLATAFSVEVSQLIRLEWLDEIRSTRIGALLLGRGFLWSDLPAYAAGTAVATMVDAIVRHRSCQRAA